MPNLYGCHFEYENDGGTLVSSRTYNLIFAAINTERILQTEGPISGVTFFNRPAKKRYLIDDDYSESPMTFDIEIITDNDEPLPYAQRRNVESWLFNRSEYRKLYIDPLDDCEGVMTESVNVATAVRDVNQPWPAVDPIYETKRLYLNCRFINPERIENQAGVYGYKVTLEADSNMWWQDPITITVDVTRTGDDRYHSRFFRINLDTDASTYCYPQVTFSVGDGGMGRATIIRNQTDQAKMGGVSRPTWFVMMPACTVTMDGETNFISGSTATSPSEDFDCYSHFYYFNFPRLLRGENTMTAYGDIQTVSITYQNRRAFL